MKKNDPGQRHRRCLALRKILNIMKLTTLLFFLALLQVSANSFSQTRLNLKFEKESLESVFSKIESSSDYSIFYKNDLIQNSKEITGEYKDASVNEILDQILKSTNLSYTIKGKLIMIVPMDQSTRENNGQQQKSVSGKVADSSGGSLPGVSVVVKGTTTGVITDMDGKYSLSNIAEKAVLQFSFVGMRMQEISVEGKTSINVVLEDETIGIEEVVAVGYGVQKKSDVTGASVKVSSEEIKSRPVSNAIQAMQGKAAGVDITSSERPGSLGNITIRGVRSLTASNSPLYVVDGIPLMTNIINKDQNVTLGGIDNLNTSDIESIDVLKDASATAIYGSRGANGVVIITTKKGKEGKLTLNYSSSFTTETLNEDSKLMNAGEYIEWRRWAKYYANPTAFPRGDQPNQANDYIIFLGSSDPSAWANIQKGWDGGTWDGSKVTTTDWTKIVTRKGTTQEHNISASGGGKNMNGYISFGYLDNKGTVKGQGYTRYTGKVSFDVHPKKWFSIDGNINGSYSVNEYGQSSIGTNNANPRSGLYQAARDIFTWAVPYDSNGIRVENPGGELATKTVIDEWKYSQDQRVTYRTMGSFNAQIDFSSISPRLNGLKFRMNFGPDFTLYRDGVYIDAKSINRTGSSFASLEKSQTFTYTLDNLIYYDKTIGKHNFGATFLQSQTKFRYETNAISADGIPFASQKWNALSTGNVPLSKWNSDLTEKQLMSYMARLNYSFSQKYLLTLSGRYDGASQLSEGHKWAFFPSAALGWRIDQENFIKGIQWINQLKARIGVGITGNSAIDPYATKGGLTSLFYPYNATPSSGSVNASTLANENLGWEKTTQYNLGIDYSILGGKVSGVLDLYTSKTTDLLMAMTIPSVTGYATTYANIGETANKGIDLTINTVNVKTNKFEWSTSLNGSWQKDHIVSLANGKQDDINNGWFIGQSQGVIYGYESNGLWQEGDAAEIAKFNANGHKFSTGMTRPVDQNGDYIIDANHDKVIIGSTRPKYVVGMTNTLSYNNFELSIFLYGRLGYLYNTGGESQGGRNNQRSINYYNEKNKNADYQKPIYSEGSGDVYYGSLGYKNASFIKVRNISLGYKIPNAVAAKWGISNLRLYVQAVNPGMLFRKIDWMDMDVVSSYSNRGFTAGINVGF